MLISLNQLTNFQSKLDFSVFSQTMNEYMTLNLQGLGIAVSLNIAREVQSH